jgi:ATP-dependent DNA helicase RecQ
VETSAVRAAAEDVLRRLAGDVAALRADQWRAIEALVVDRRRVLCVQRTGWGKSAVYFVATALLRQRGAGPTLIVSPLLALMRNQIAAAERAGIRAYTINSANLEEWDGITAEIHAGSVDLLLVSPERLNNPEFREAVLPKLAATTGLLVVDEAHCVSDWGHDFRPDYRRLRDLLAQLAPDTPVLATTATANARVTADVAEQLGTEPAAGGGEALVLRGPLDRPSLRLSVLDLPTPALRLAWLADHLARVPGSGIVYTLTVAAAQETADFLRLRGYGVAAYTGQADDAERRAAERDLLDNKLKALVATSALGMGFDKPDLGFVVHLGAPPSPIAYYQQVGRAGRAVRSAEVILLPGAEDAAIWRYFGSLAFPPEEQVHAVLAALSTAGRPLSTPALEALVELRRTRLELMLKVLDVDGAVRRVRGGWVATGMPWTYDAVRHRRVAQARAAEQQAMREYVSTAGCRMEFLRRCLDDPGAVPCGRCDRCADARVSEPVVGDRQPPWKLEVSAPTLAAAQAFLARPGVEIAPRRQWPAGLSVVGLALSGRIPAEEQPDAGRALGRLSDLGWGGRLRALLADDAPDGPVPEDAFGAVVEVLKAWAHGDNRWSTRPAGVVVMASRRRPELVATLGERIAAVGRLPLLGMVARIDDGARPDEAGGVPHRDGEAGGRANSAHRVIALRDAFDVPDTLAGRLPSLTGPVLLVDDYVDSGWTMAIVARLLRRAGATGVLPLALGLSA